jgi:hypothetical protein
MLTASKLPANIYGLLDQIIETRTIDGDLRNEPFKM